MHTAVRTLNRRTGMVYAGAAVLIVVVGLRVVLQTSDEMSLGLLEWVTMGALGLEFTLLLFYAWTISAQKMDEVSPPANHQLKHHLHYALQPLSHRLDDIIKSNEKLNASLQTFVEQITHLQTATAYQANKSGKIAAKLEELVNGDFQRRVSEETRRLLERSLRNLQSPD